MTDDETVIATDTRVANAQTATAICKAIARPTCHRVAAQSCCNSNAAQSANKLLKPSRASLTSFQQGDPDADRMLVGLCYMILYHLNWAGECVNEQGLDHVRPTALP